MVEVDDPLLALIVRFVAGNDWLDTSDQEFLERQAHALGVYLERFPKEERSSRALKWIEQYAEQYRNEWKKRAVAKEVSKQRCADCPLRDRGDPDSTCAVHDRWVDLLTCYVLGQINSGDYVRNTLGLLEEHKAELLVASGRHSVV